MSKPGDSRGGPVQDDQLAATLARRKLLKLTLYGAPAIIGTFTMRDAAAATCEPNTQCPPDTGCQPTCVPSQCGPQVCRPAR